MLVYYYCRVVVQHILNSGWMAGAGKRTIIWTKDDQEPELMALLAGEICISLEEVIESLRN